LSLITLIKRKLSQDGFGAFMIKTVSGSFFIKGFNSAASLATGVLLARMLGADGFGGYSYALSWVMLLSVIARMGQDSTVVRYTARYVSRDDWPHLKGLVWFSIIVITLASLLCMLTGALLIPVIIDEDKAELAALVGLALFLIPLQSLMAPFNTALSGLRLVLLSQMPNLFIRPLLFLIFIIAAYYFFGESLTAVNAIILSGMAILIGLLVSIGNFASHIPFQFSAIKASMDTRVWLKGVLPLLFISGMHVINSNADILMLGTLRDAASAGIYKAASSFAAFIDLIFIITIAGLNPVIAHLHDSGSSKRLQAGLTKAVRISFVLALFAALPLLLFSDSFLSLFGKEFIASNRALDILIYGHLFNISCGYLGPILIMTGAEKWAAFGMVVGAITNVILNYLFIPIWGVEGASLATSLSMVVWNVLLVVIVIRKVKIDPTILGILYRPKTLADS
jgi:O-antigen/teichoic acid export membrane protein